MNRQEAIKIVFDVLNRELVKIGRGSDTMARAVIDALIEAGQSPIDPKRHNLIGFQIIGDMTREELINECVAFHREHCKTVDTDELKNAVIVSRVMRFKERLTAEAKMSPPTGLMGFWGSGPVKTDD